MPAAILRALADCLLKRRGLSYYGKPEEFEDQMMEHHPDILNQADELLDAVLRADG